MPPAEDYGGVLPQHQQLIARRLRSMSMEQRVRALAMLNIFVSTVVQEISAFIEAATHDLPTPPAGAAFTTNASAAEVPLDAHFVEQEEEEVVECGGR